MTACYRRLMRVIEGLGVRVRGLGSGVWSVVRVWVEAFGVMVEGL